MNITNITPTKSSFTINHLVIIGILVLAFSISFLIRSQPADFGYELHEFDPFFNYRATQFIVEHGIIEYFNWNDELSWYPIGRDVSNTSQVMLHITTAISYLIFGGGMDLYEYAIIFPVIIGSLTSVIIFALVRTLGGTTAGLFASLFFALSVPIIVRGSVGWLKSEPLGLFYGLIGLYLFLSGIKSTNNKISFLKLIGGGVFLAFSLSAWGGSQFFLLPIGIFFLTLPFTRSDHKFLLWAIPLFSSSFLITSLNFERLGFEFLTGLGGFAIIGPTLFLAICVFVQNKSSDITKTRNGLVLLAIAILLGTIILSINSFSEFIDLPSFRYLNAINPFLTTSDPLVDSVAEHATTTLQQSFFFHSVLMIFAGIGIWILLSKTKSFPIKNDMISFSIIFGIIGVYISSAFVRMEIFASTAIIILSSIGLSVLTKKFLNHNHSLKSNFIGFISVTGFIVLLVVPLVLHDEGNPLTALNAPPTILNGGTMYPIATNDWIVTLEWIKNNTPEDAVVASWWDYGYWIQTKAERATLADNSTIYTHIIQNIAKMLLSSPDDAWKMLQDMKADYIVVFVSGERINVDFTGSFYLLEGGGDESKKHWFMKIAQEPLDKYLYSDDFTGKDNFWENTILGKMFPFQPIFYTDFQTDFLYEEYSPGLTPIYVKENKFPESENGPLKLVYASPSYQSEEPGPILTVFVYEINKNYVPTS